MLLETRPRQIADSELNAKSNVARPDLQQRETDSTPFVISKTNSNETVGNQRAEIGSQRRQIALATTGSQRAMLHLMLHHPVEGCRRVRKPDLPDIGPQNSMLIDSHTHIQFPEFDADRDAVIKRALEAGVWMVNVGTNVESSKKAVELAHQYKEGMYASVGIHPVRDEISNGASPHDAEANYNFAKIEELARDPKVVGIGETGLDYFKITNNESRIKEQQKELFVKHIELAQKVSKPLIIHCRDAHDDLLELLKANSYKLKADAGVMHFFGGEGAWENLDKYLAMGFYISLAGVITFKNYEDAENIKKIPLDRIIIETDAPYAAPEPHRGRRNEPSYVKFVAEKIAKSKDVSFEEAGRQTTANTRMLFSI